MSAVGGSLFELGRICLCEASGFRLATGGCHRRVRLHSNEADARAPSRGVQSEDGSENAGRRSANSVALESAVNQPTLSKWLRGSVRCGTSRSAKASRSHARGCTKQLRFYVTAMSAVGGSLFELGHVYSCEEWLWKSGNYRLRKIGFRLR